jgi:hypothetical protein
MLGRLGLDVEQGAVILGGDSTGQPIGLRLFRPVPTSVTFVGGWWAAQVLIFRCMALGAVVALSAPVPDTWQAPVPTATGAMATPGRWMALDNVAGGTGRRVFLIADDQPVTLPPDPTQPVLRLYDLGPEGPSSLPVLGAWQMQLTVLTRPTQASARALATADLVLAQRLAPADANVVGSVLGLDGETMLMLAHMHDDVIAGLGPGANQPAWLRPTSIERRLFGEPMR